MAKGSITKAAKSDKSKVTSDLKRKRGERGVSVPDKRIIEALDKARGHITMAARIIGCAPNTIRNRLKASKAVAEAYEEICESTLDFVESKLLIAIDSGDFQAIKFYLEHKGAKRGYANRQELEISAPGAAILAQIAVADIDRILALRQG